MANAKNDVPPMHEKIMVLGAPGSGKTYQIRTLPGRKFVYFFDPAGKRSIRGADIDYEEFLPNVDEIDWALRGFNKNSKDDRSRKPKEPTVYNRWEKHLNDSYDAGMFKNYDWLCIDSLTLLAQAVMDREMFLNGRYGGVSDLADYRLAGEKMSRVFAAIATIPIGLYLTGHLQDRQDELTKKITITMIAPGSARTSIPLVLSNIWELRSTTDEAKQYILLTRPEPRGFQSLRTTLQGIPAVVDVGVKDPSTPERFGIGKLLTDAYAKEKTHAA